MADIVLEQALYTSERNGDFRLVARSPGFANAWHSEAEGLCSGFGARPTGVACPAALFVKPLSKTHIAVVQVDDQATYDGLLFRLLAIAHTDYVKLGGDPFAINDRFPRLQQTQGALESLSCPKVTPPARTVEDVQHVLKRTNGPELLGGSQVLVDGGRLVFERPAPDNELLRDLWMLLPWQTRAQLWPASFAFSNSLAFDAVVVPKVEGHEFDLYVTEKQAGEYPAGRYERNLQIAVEAGDQAELNRLFARRSGRETLRLGLLLVAAVMVLTLLLTWLTPPVPEDKPKPAAPAGDVLPALPPIKRMTASEQDELALALRGLAGRLGVEAPADADAEKLLALMDRHLSRQDRHRDSRPIGSFGPLEWQLRMLLWKQRVAEYARPDANPLELVERLEQQLKNKK